MNKKLLELREKSLQCLGETRISDGEAEINRILLDLSETDEQDLDIKFKTLNNVSDYLLSKSKLKISNSDLEYLRELASELRLNYEKKSSELSNKDSLDLQKLLDIIKRNY